MATRFRLVPLDDVGLGDRLQRASGMSRLPAARLARLAARAAGDPRRLPQAIARRRLATVRTVFVQLTPKLRHLLPQRRVFRPQNLNLPLQRRNQIPISGRRIIHTLTHISPSPVPKIRTPSRLFTNTVAIPTSPQLGSYGNEALSSTWTLVLPPIPVRPLRSINCPSDYRKGLSDFFEPARVRRPGHASAQPGLENRHPVGSPAARRAAASASTRAASRRMNWVLRQPAIVNSGRAAIRRAAVRFASSGWPFSW